MPRARPSYRPPSSTRSRAWTIPARRRWEELKGFFSGGWEASLEKALEESMDAFIPGKDMHGHTSLSGGSHYPLVVG